MPKAIAIKALQRVEQRCSVLAHWHWPLLLLSFWPVWRWYVLRLLDGADEPWQIFAAAGSILFLRGRRRERPSSVPMVAGLLLYSATYPFVPPLVRAFIAFHTLLLCAYPLRRCPPGVVLMVTLALPIFATLDYLLSYPLRRLTALLALPLIELAGFQVVIAGNSFEWKEALVLIDAPCSGVRMLYTGMLLSSLLAALLRLHWRDTIRLLFFAVLTVTLGNALRAASLFFLESGAFSHPLFIQYEPLLHPLAGLFLFACSAAAITAFALRRKGQPPSTSKIQLVIPPREKGSSSLFLICLLAALIPFIPKERTSPAPKLSILPEMARAIIEQRRLSEIHSEPLDQRFKAGFPGIVRQFRNGSAELLLRTVPAPTRLLHSSFDCFRGIGYRVAALPSTKDAEGRLWSCFKAEQKALSLKVCEHLVDTGSGHWSDVSHWYWSSLLRNADGPWTALTFVERNSE